MVVAFAIARVSANEVRRIVGAAATLVHGDLGIRTEGPRTIHYTAGGVMCDDFLWWDAMLDPSLEIREWVERAGSLASVPSRRHEQPIELLRLREGFAARLPAMDERYDVLVVLDASSSRVNSAAPGVVVEDLAAVIP